MTTVDMGLLKEVRAITNAPLKDCKQALEETNNNIEAAQEWLKQKGILKAISKADRITKEGIVLADHFGGKTVVITLACETDFVARNETFRSLANEILAMVAQSGPIDALTGLDEGIKKEIDEHLQAHFVSIGENMQLTNAFVGEGKSYIYRHSGEKLVAVVFYEGDEGVAKVVAMQVAAMNPLFVSVDQIPQFKRQESIDRYASEMADSGKPQEIIAKIVEGKVAKEFNELVLLEQYAITDDTKKVKEILGSTQIHSFVRCMIGG